MATTAKEARNGFSGGSSLSITVSGGMWTARSVLLTKQGEPCGQGFFHHIVARYFYL